MAAEVELVGGAHLARISRELRRTAEGKVIKKTMTKDLRASAKPIVPAVRASIRANIPSNPNGDLKRALSKATKLQVRTTGRDAGVSVRVDGRKMPERQGALPAYMEGTRRPWRHPVYGNRDVWVTQAPHPYFYRVARTLGPRSKEAINKSLDEITRSIL